MRHIRTALAPEPGLYSQGVVIDPAACDLIFLAGQTGNVPGVPGEPVIDGGVAEQTARTLENLLGVIRAAGGDAASFVALDVFLKDAGTPEGRTASRKAFNAAYEAFFAACGVARDKLPARAMLWVPEVPLEAPVEDTQVEIKGVAAVPKSR